MRADFSILTTILGLPLAGAIAVAFVPRNYRFRDSQRSRIGDHVCSRCWRRSGCSADLIRRARKVINSSRAYDWVQCTGDHAEARRGRIERRAVLMGAIVAFAATCMSYMIKEREKEYYLLLLVMITGILGAFASLDIFFFFFFHELALIPTFIMIGVWGRGEDKNYATFNITLYLTLGALIALIGLIALYVQTGANDLRYRGDHRAREGRTRFRCSAQNWIFPLLLVWIRHFGFACGRFIPGRRWVTARRRPRRRCCTPVC